MPRIPLIARRSFLYAGRRLERGAEFGARTQSDARLLIAIGHAEFAPQVDAEADPEALQVVVIAPAPAAAVVETSAETAAEVPADPPAQPPAEAPSAEPVAETSPAAAPADGEESPRTGKPRRQYRRRDLTAEGTE